MKVYLAEYRYFYEGSTIIGIFATKELAEAKLLNLGYAPFNGRWEPANRYRDGSLALGDVAEITEHEVVK